MKTTSKPKKGYPNMPKTWSEPLVDYVIGSQLEQKVDNENCTDFSSEHMIAS